MKSEYPYPLWKRKSMFEIKKRKVKNYKAVKITR